ncbi:ParB N-terminal domain-containing protein [Sulfitobacter sp. S190]|uniref:ParB/RepB/Spo0J family partition protein n=1 Tax=Sulfitobacter sp. S190 TaxID=2867022 RepID=UPI0021A39E96|nr:ParB N-terminal domain-containing protein [Sulfitobacter sp. S190]UWR24414.1 ParB N-terminal domain-containing protein [Sulfitobacter sp. S190]
MGKRKRLTPANPDYVAAAPETKSFTLGPAGSGMRRAPVAQVAGDSAAVAALEEVSETLRKAREEGRLVLSLPLEAIDTDYLVRDRLRAGDEELEALCNSIAARGQQNPIEVTALPGDRYGLISGWRRLTALKRLAADRPEAGFDVVLALLRQPGDSAESYLAMVEENEIRVGLSYYERARIAARAVDVGVFGDAGDALRSLYANASRSKRSKIRSFLTLVGALDDVLRFPESIGERLGLKLAAALEGDPKATKRLVAQLGSLDPATPEAEKSCLENFATGKGTGPAVKRAKPPSPAKTPATAGVKLEHDAKNRVVLSGPGVTPEFVSRVREFISDL